jgi:hypothetical protein
MGELLVASFSLVIVLLRSEVDASLGTPVSQRWKPNSRVCTYKGSTGLYRRQFSTPSSSNQHNPDEQHVSPAIMATTSIKTSIPSHVTEASLIRILHDHQPIVNALAPGNTACKLMSGDPAAMESPCEYSVTAPTPIGTSTYPLTITNLPDGVDTLVQPKVPVGKLEIRAKWRVANAQLVEDVEIDGNFMTKRLVLPPSPVGWNLESSTSANVSLQNGKGQR